MRGRHRTAAADTTISPAQRPGAPVQSARGDADTAAMDGPIPRAQRPDDEDADGEQRDQLDHGFDGYGRDDPVMPFARIQPARSEEDGEGGQPRRDGGGQQRRFLGRVRAGGGDGAEGQRDRLQLECDVGRRADDREQGHQRGQTRGLAEARGHEVGDGRDALGSADGDEAAKHPPPSDEDERRTEVDRHEL